MSAAKALLLALALTGTAPLARVTEPADYRVGAERFIADMAGKHGFERDALKALLDQASYQQDIIDAINRPYEGLPWPDYRKLFLTPERIQAGVDFWRDHAAILSRAESTYGVAPEIIVAIIGVETNYGANVGTHRVIDALTTLGFAYPKRADFFRSELVEYLLLTREEEIDPLVALGSYAGAVGKPQFISSSYRAFAVDFDADGRRDLWHSDPDVIGSVANYFQRHGWRPGKAVAIPATFSGDDPPRGLAVSEQEPLMPSLTAESLRAAGVAWTAPLEPSAPLTLIRLPGPVDEYWIGLDNFYVVTRYNHSNLYAMAVHQLSQEIRARHDSDGRSSGQVASEAERNAAR